MFNLKAKEYLEQYYLCNGCNEILSRKQPHFKAVSQSAPFATLTLICPACFEKHFAGQSFGDFLIVSVTPGATKK